MHLGWIVLDIDGTITLDRYSVPKEVVDYLRERQKEGYSIAMATGRPVTFASFALKSFDFPYLFLAQNGSCAYLMPEKKRLFERYIPKKKLYSLEEAMEGVSSDFVIYSGHENQDRVFYRPDRFNEQQTRYLEAYWQRQKEESIAIHTLDEIRQPSVPLLKCFGSAEEMHQLARRVLSLSLFNVACLRDPFTEGYSILLITDERASKGQSFEEASSLLSKEEGVVIAAGDDENDISLFEVADISIAMHHAPEKMQQMAHFIAPPTKDLGILHALKAVLKSVSSL